MTLRLAAAAFILTAPPAMADITADDVWANTTAFFAATGGSLTAEMDRNGNQTFLDRIVLEYHLPSDVGSFWVFLPPMTMLDEPDGSVTQLLPKSFDVRFNAVIDLISGENMDMTLSVTQADFSGRATGTPGDITYQRSAGAITAKLTESFLDNLAPDVGMDISATGEGYSSTSRVTEADLITTETEVTVLPLALSMSVDEGAGARSVTNSTYGTTVTRSRMALPAGGSDMMNLAPAFAAGMMIESISTGAGMTDQTTDYVGGDVFLDQQTRSGTTSTRLSLSADGLLVEGSVADFEAIVDEREFLNATVDLKAAEIGGRYLVPIMAAPGPQASAIALSVTDLVLDDATWDLFDPASVLPRDPASIDLDITGNAVMGVDLFNFSALGDMLGRQDLPVVPQDLSINVLSISAAGASMDASGDFKLDATDLDTFDGFPRPEGSMTVNIIGANTLMDRLVALGGLSDSDLGGARMMMGMFTRPVGDDHVNTSMKINPEGHVFVNGERVR